MLGSQCLDRYCFKISDLAFVGMLPGGNISRNIIEFIQIGSLWLVGINRQIGNGEWS